MKTARALLAFVIGFALAAFAFAADSDTARQILSNVAGGFLATLFLGRSIFVELDAQREWNRGHAAFTGYKVPPPEPVPHPLLDKLRGRKRASPEETT